MYISLHYVCDITQQIYDYAMYTDSSTLILRFVYTGKNWWFFCGRVEYMDSNGVHTMKSTPTILLAVLLALVPTLTSSKILSGLVYYFIFYPLQHSGGFAENTPGCWKCLPVSKCFASSKMPTDPHHQGALLEVRSYIMYWLCSSLIFLNIAYLFSILGSVSS